MAVWGVGKPPTYTEIESYPFKQWLQSVWTWIQTRYTVVTIYADYTVPATAFYVRSDGTSGAVNVTLPAALGLQGRQLLIKKIDSGTGVGHHCHIVCAGSDTIEGSASVTLSNQWEFVHLISNGINGWEKM